jgi:hypothetical protein
MSRTQRIIAAMLERGHALPEWARETHEGSKSFDLTDPRDERNLTRVLGLVELVAFDGFSLISNYRVSALYACSIDTEAGVFSGDGSTRLSAALAALEAALGIEEEVVIASADRQGRDRLTP